MNDFIHEKFKEFKAIPGIRTSEDIYVRTDSAFVKLESDLPVKLASETISDIRSGQSPKLFDAPSSMSSRSRIFDRWILDEDVNLSLDDEIIGKGRFGRIYRGKYHRAVVAFKTIPNDAVDPYIREGNLFFEVNPFTIN